jgi:hypothetical protein
MKLRFKIENPADAYALRVVVGLAALVGLELVFRVASVGEIILQVLIFTVLGAFGLYRYLKRFEND